MNIIGDIRDVVALFLAVVSVSGVLTAAFHKIDTKRYKAIAVLEKEVDTIKVAQSNIQTALLANLHHTLYTECSRIIKEKEVSIDDLDNLKYLFEGYKALGGNGTGETLYNKVCNLPIKHGG